VDGGKDTDSVHGAYCCNGRWFIHTWSRDGFIASHGCPHQLDLIPKPKVHKLDVWVNVYLDDNGKAQTGPGWSNKADADGYLRRIACIHIQRDITEGEGL